MRRLLLVALLSAGLCGALAPAALAVNPVIADCSAHNQLTRHYSVAQLRNALSTLPADVKEYTDCYDAIDRQLLRQVGKLGAGGSGGGGSFLPGWLIALLVAIALAGAGYAGLVLRRRRDPPPH